MDIQHPNPEQRARCRAFIHAMQRITAEWRRCFGSRFTNEIHWTVFSLIMYMRWQKGTQNVGSEKLDISFSYIFDHLPIDPNAEPNSSLSEIRKACDQFLVELKSPQELTFRPTEQLMEAMVTYVSRVANHLIRLQNEIEGTELPMLEIKDALGTTGGYMMFLNSYGDQWRLNLRQMLMNQGYSLNFAYQRSKHLFSAVNWHLLANIYLSQNEFMDFHRGYIVTRSEILDKINQDLDFDASTIKGIIQNLLFYGIIKRSAVADFDEILYFEPRQFDLLTENFESGLQITHSYVENIRSPLAKR